MNHDLKENEQLYDKLVDRLARLEQDSSVLISDKKELADFLDIEQAKQKLFTKNVKQLQQGILEKKCTSQSLLRVGQEN